MKLRKGGVYLSAGGYLVYITGSMESTTGWYGLIAPPRHPQDGAKCDNEIRSYHHDGTHYLYPFYNLTKELSQS